MIRKGERVCGVPYSMVQLSQANKRIAELEAEVERLRRRCNEAADALSLLPEEALEVANRDRRTHWYIRDALIQNLREKEATDGEES